jgi:cysteine rich repeat protein
MRALHASFVVAALLAPCCMSELGAVRAQQPSSGLAQPPPHQACKPDIQKFCADLRPGSGRIAQCLLANKDRLSSSCRDDLARIGVDHAGKSDSGKPQ